MVRAQYPVILTPMTVQNIHPINETIPRSGRSGTLQAPASLQNAKGGKLRGEGAFLTGLSWSPKSGRSPVRGIDESSLMMSQLG